MIYFISDLHLGDEAVIRHSNRPFKSAKEMDQTIIDNWNSRVSENDTVYIVGDFLFGDSKIENKEERIEDYINSLKGHKILILGDYDKKKWTWINPRLLVDYFDGVYDYLQIKLNQKDIIMCHYPCLSYENEDSAYMIYGHIHNCTNIDFYPLILKREKMLNAGVDVNNFMPVTFEELIENNEKIRNNN